MEIKEYQERREEINKELRKLEDEYIKSKTDLKVGDKVKFVEQGDYYLGEKDKKHKGVICRFEVRHNGDISIHCNGILYSPWLKDVIKCKKD